MGRTGQETQIGDVITPGCKRVTARSATLAMLALFLGVGIASASTKRLPTFVRQWGSLGTGNGQFDRPVGVEILDDLLNGLAHRTWARVDWSAYDANGLTRPAVSH